MSWQQMIRQLIFTGILLLLVYTVKFGVALVPSLCAGLLALMIFPTLPQGGGDDDHNRPRSA